MAKDIHTLSTTDASNTARFPENQAPSTLNNGGRELEGMVARWYFDTEASVVATVSGSVIQMTINRVSITSTASSSNYIDDLLIAFQMGSVTSPDGCSVNINNIGKRSLRDNRGQSLSVSAIPVGSRAIIQHDRDNGYFRLLFDIHTLTNKKLVAPILGTPASGTLTNCTGLPIAGLSDAGTLAGVSVFYETKTWAVAGDIAVPSVATNYIPGMFVDLASGWTAKLVSVRRKIRGGTNCVFTMQEDGSNIAGFISLTAVTSVSETAPTAQTIADASYLAPVVTSISSSPDNLTISAVIEHTKT